MAKATVPKRKTTRSKTGMRRSHLQRKLKMSTGLWGLFNKKSVPKTSSQLTPLPKKIPVEKPRKPQNKK